MSLTDHDQHFIGNIAQKALIERDGKILLVRYPDDDHPVASGKWDLPGGRLHDGESPLEGLKREVKEETGAEIEVHEILATGVNRVSDTFKLFFVIYRCALVDVSHRFIPEPGEIDTIEWRDKKDFFTLPIIYAGYQEALKGIL